MTVYMTIDEAASALKCSARHIKRMIAKNAIDHIDIGLGGRKMPRVKLPEPGEPTATPSRGRKKKYVGKVLTRPE